MAEQRGQFRQMSEAFEWSLKSHDFLFLLRQQQQQKQLGQSGPEPTVLARVTPQIPHFCCSPVQTGGDCTRLRCFTHCASAPLSSSAAVRRPLAQQVRLGAAVTGETSQIEAQFNALSSDRQVKYPAGQMHASYCNGILVQ